MSKKSTFRGQTHKKSLTQEQRARRKQSILFSALAGIMILSMLVALIAR